MDALNEPGSPSAAKLSSFFLDDPVVIVGVADFDGWMGQLGPCPGCGLPNYSGLCPVCRGDEQGYRDELQFAFGPWHRAAGEGDT